jgi:hypothetical protein
MYANARSPRRARPLGNPDGVYTFPGTPASFPGLGATDAEQAALDAAALAAAQASYPENPFASMTEEQKTLYWAGQFGTNAGQLSGVYQPVGGVIDPVAQQQAASTYLATNAEAIQQVTTAVQAAQDAHQSAASYANDYIAQSGGDLGVWFTLSNPGARRYTMASNGGALLDNALLQYMALKSAGAPGISALDASAAAADAQRAADYQASLSTGGFTSGMIPPQTAQSALQAIVDAGGDPQQWTSVVDSGTGATIGLVKQSPDGSITMAPATGASMSLDSVAQTVTGFIDRAAGTIQNVGATVQKVGNAIKGAEAGATAGWNLPPNASKYFLIGGALIVATLIFAPSGRSKGRR